MNLFEINNYINELLDTKSYPDDSANGLQIESSNVEVSRIALAVDAGQSVIESACKQNADLLIVHHGVFWGQSTSVTGILAKKVNTLIDSGCSLLAQHLPLDGDMQFGNNIELARLFQLEDIQRFCPHGEGQFIGTSGKLTKPQPLSYFTDKASTLAGFTHPLTLEFGKKEISSCAIVSGSGSFTLSMAAEQGFDLLISGEPKQSNYHDTKELGINAAFYGHYATETVGVKALGKHLKEKFTVETFFIDEPTGI